MTKEAWKFQDHALKLKISKFNLTQSYDTLKRVHKSLLFWKRRLFACLGTLKAKQLKLQCCRKQ